MEFFKQKKQDADHRDVANGWVWTQSGQESLTELVNEGTLEFTSFGGATFIKLAGC